MFNFAKSASGIPVGLRSTLWLAERNAFGGYEKLRARRMRWEIRDIPIIRGRWQNKMPDVDPHESSSGIAVDVQQRLNCALP